MKNKVFTLPNLMSFLRLPMAVLIVLDISLTAKYLCFTLGCLTDYLDGRIARKNKQASPLGAFLDPLFDRLFVLIVFVFYFMKLNLPWYFIVFLFARDLCTALASLIILALRMQSKVEIKARFSGKIVTIIQFTVLLALIAENMSLMVPGFYLTLIMSVISLADYAVYAIKGIKAVDQGEPVNSIDS